MLQENGQMCKIQKCRRCSKAEDVLEQEGAKAFQMRGEAGAEPSRTDMVWRGGEGSRHLFRHWLC